MKIAVIGCGRWGSFITWYLDHIGHDVTLYGRKNSAHMQQFLKERKNNLLTLPESVHLTTDLTVVQDAETIIISINSQGLQKLMEELEQKKLHDKKIVFYNHIHFPIFLMDFVLLCRYIFYLHHDHLFL